MGGLRWLKRVVDHIETKGRFDVRKVDNDRTIASRINMDRTIIWTCLSFIDDLRLYHNHFVEWAFKNMIRNADRIITVSVSSMHQLYSICGLSEDE
jgi:hypothetical protein